jgi:hypothetical protein
MSKHNNRYLQQIETAVRKDLKRMDSEEMLYVYGITIDESDAVHDTVNDIVYQTVNRWLDVYLDDSREEVDQIGNGWEWDE